MSNSASPVVPTATYSQARRVDMSALPQPANVQQLHHYAYKA